MLVRCSTWSRDGYRCLCACSLRPSVSAPHPPTSLLFVKLQMNYFLPIHHRPIWGGRRAKCGSELRSYGDAKQKDIDLSARTFHFSALSDGFMCLMSYIIKIQFSRVKELMQHNNKFKSNATEISYYPLCFLWKKLFWLYWPWMRTAFMNVLALISVSVRRFPNSSFLSALGSEVRLRIRTGVLQNCGYCL